jgi:hypothetical protein
MIEYNTLILSLYHIIYILVILDYDYKLKVDYLN